MGIEGNKKFVDLTRHSGVVMGVLLTLVACGSDTSSIESVTGFLMPTEGEGPLYGVVSRITLPSGASTVVAIVDSLEAQHVDTRTALELAGFAAAHGSLEIPGAVFMGSAEAPEFTRYELGADGILAPGASFSLANFGLSRAPRSVVFVSPTRAYAISAETHQLFVWNPEQMIVDRVIELGMLERPGYTPAWVFGAAVLGNQLLIPITWVRADEGDPGAAPDSALLVVNVDTGALSVQEEGRCGGFRAIYPSGSGDVYFSSSAGAPATWNRLYGERGGSAPCLVRLRPGQAAIDDSFLLRPAEFAPHPVAVDFSPAGPDHLIFQALDESLVSPDAQAEELWSAAAWRFYSIPASALETGGVGAAELVDLPASALNALRFRIDDQHFVPQILADYSQTTLVNISDPANPVDGPTIQGSVGNFFRIR